MSKLNSQYNTEIDSSNTIKIRVSAHAANTSTPWAFDALYGNNVFLDTSKALELVSCSITHTVPNISVSQANNVFELQTTSGLFTLVIADGFYSTTSLIDVILPALNAFITPSVAAMEVQTDGLFHIQITSGAAQIRNTPNNSVGSLLGYQTLNAFTTNLIADVLPMLQGITYFHVISRKIGTNCFTNSTNGTNLGSCLFSIPVTVPFGFQNVFDNSNNQERIRFNTEFSLKNFDINLFDQNFRLLDDMDPRSEVELILKVIY